MNSVERVKAICKERKIPISKLESDLKFGNGYVGQLRKGVFPADRLAKIADYLSVTTDYLLTGKETKKAPTPEDERMNNDPDLYRIERARKSMSEADKKKMMNILKASFEDYFSDNYADDDLDE